MLESGHTNNVAPTQRNPSTPPTVMPGAASPSALASSRRQAQWRNGASDDDGGLSQALSKMGIHDKDSQTEPLSDDDRSLHRSLQDDELLALGAIYPAEQVRISEGEGAASQHAVTFDLPVKLQKPMRIEIVRECEDGAVTILTLSHLPPILVRAELSPGYPLVAPPRLVSCTAPWLSSEGQDWIVARLLQQWDDVKGEVLWSWGDWLKETWADEALGGSGPLGHDVEATGRDAESDSTLTKPSRTKAKGTRSKSMPMASGKALRFYDQAPLQSAARAPVRSLAATLTAYDSLAQQSAFENDRFLCGICLEAKKGDMCIRIGHCQHVFCRECMSEFLTLHLTEGSLNLARRCPDPTCTTEQEASISDEDIVRILQGSGGGEGGDPSSASEPHPLIARLRFLEEKAQAEADPTAVPCPRQDCQTMAGARAEDRNSGGRWEAFRQCPKCSMSFCVWCRKTWHAPSPCALPATSSLIEKYDSCDEASRRVLERRYGRKNLLRLKAQYEEEKANQAWLQGQTQACPNCSSHIEKSMGCNHMSCSHCSTHFCYLCGIRINPARPYEHFNMRTSPCFNKLFDGILERPAQAVDGEDEAPGGEPAEETEEQRQRRREAEQHLMALAAIQAAYGED